MTRVLVNGANGKMGSQTVKAIETADGLILVGQADVGDSLRDMITESKADIVVDFTHPDAVFENVKTILDAGVHGLVLDVAVVDSDALEKLKAAVLDMPRQRSAGRGRASAIVPASVFPSGAAPEREEEEEDDDDDDI